MAPKRQDFMYICNAETSCRMTLCQTCHAQPIYRKKRCNQCYRDYVAQYFHCTSHRCLKPVFAATLCQYHYRQWRVSCLECTRPVYCRSLCRTHYRRAAAARQFPDEPTCAECNAVVYVNNLCLRHFKQQFQQSCAMVDCEKASHKRGLCCAHYFQLRRAAQARE